MITKRRRKWTIRTMMTILFLAALLTTFQSISGVEAKTMASFFYGAEDRDEAGQSNFDERVKPIGLALKKRVAQMEPKISANDVVSRNMPSLEEEIDLSKYPVKTVLATGYTAGYESTGKNPGHPEFGITYSGVKVKRDLYSTVAADLNVFPIGTVLFIPGYGYGVVADKGGAINGNELDLYYKTVKDVYEQWGKKTLQVYVVEMGDGTLTEEKLKTLNENESMQVFRQQYFGTKSE